MNKTGTLCKGKGAFPCSYGTSGQRLANGNRQAAQGRDPCNPPLVFLSLVERDMNSWIFLGLSGSQFLHLTNELNNITHHRLGLMKPNDAVGHLPRNSGKNDS